ncbi:Protein N-acetyltransferase, RimJ/RimL family [Devosia crocina]|uniref:Protein N-acetyltransferase, RimJ/RimL family n=1 Tax=Devosia crocina TaxID=429728 RepID=A0A1I7NRT2_9HYPH|nr:GNAT family N-acetyltransferase [Devosia crocina]SFV37387.1 Protein N-acetyltransferase, RimJ/RimL family [Devosia crocina]
MMLPIIETDRLILRAPRPQDASAIARYLNDFEVAGNLARVPFPYTLADAEAWLRTRHTDMAVEDANFTIELKGRGYVGHVGFHPGPDGPIIGYWLGKPFWGQGIMTEAAATALDWFFEASKAPVVYSGVFHFNHASLAIQHKLGFTQTGRSWLLCLARDAEVEHIDTQLTLGVWKARRT